MALKPTDVYGSLQSIIEDTLVGVGALRGAPCTVKSVVPTTDGNVVTFSWTDTSNVEHTQTMTVKNGEKVNIEDALDELTIFDDSVTNENSGWTSSKIKSYVDNAIGGALDGSY